MSHSAWYGEYVVAEPVALGGLVWFDGILNIVGHSTPNTLLYIYMKYVMNSISFQTLFVWAFKIVVDSWEFSMLLLYILWDVGLIFMISGSNEQLQ